MMDVVGLGGSNVKSKRPYRTVPCCRVCVCSRILFLPFATIFFDFAIVSSAPSLRQKVHTIAIYSIRQRAECPMPLLSAGLSSMRLCSFLFFVCVYNSIFTREHNGGVGGGGWMGRVCSKKTASAPSSRFFLRP
jgi:hypothetical protein